tara:strand:+ start:9944 stop:10675 length:732 start_codon:yes stop_codon:yes gene_type:complete
MVPWIGIAVAAVGALGQGISAIVAKGKEKNAKDAKEEAEREIERLENSRQPVVNPYESLTNEYANMSVATQAAEFQAEEADIALANTLDTIRATGAGAGGATALAQAALRSKRGISASIEKQETANEQLRAKGQMEVNQLKAMGEDIKWQREEQRDIIELDRAQADMEQKRAQEQQYRSDKMASITGMMGSLVSLGGSIAGGGGGGGGDGSGQGDVFGGMTQQQKDMLYQNQQMMGANTGINF